MACRGTAHAFVLGSDVSDGLDLERLYSSMVRMRAFEQILASLWRRGLVSGEMHLGIGEEGVVAGLFDHLDRDDALALDYRPTPALLAHGVSPAAIALEVLGHGNGLNAGHGGHMHLFSPEHRSASTGIVGSPAPLACGLALATQRLRPGSIAVGFFGDGAVNQGMVMEAWNLASVWNLPALFVCKDNQWAATTRTDRLTAGSIAGRARSFGLNTRVVDGTDVLAVRRAAGPLVAAARCGEPGILVAKCRRPSGHMLDDTLSRTARSPREVLSMAREAMRGRVGVSSVRHMAGLTGTLAEAIGDRWLPHRDPLRTAARRLGDRAEEIERAARDRLERELREVSTVAGVAL